MPTLLAEFRHAGFQKGRDFLSVHLPMVAGDVRNCGFCIVAFEKATARNEFMVAFQGRGMRYAASAPRVSAAPSVPLEVLLATDALLQERSRARVAPSRSGALGAAVRWRLATNSAPSAECPCTIRAQAAGRSSLAEQPSGSGGAAAAGGVPPAVAQVKFLSTSRLTKVRTLSAISICRMASVPQSS
ncbi:unnamed protein product [Prorocentrum cordatum]|uniref:RNA-dependent RNA polymerase n=1 Tax=Prorocentrum cordatum TaxID=2364126 RepID=A0ABN9TP46_9DINO|nr:unnamed protein product [Polarella glacialis]